MGETKIVKCDCCKRGPLKAYVEVNGGVLHQFVGKSLVLIGGIADREFGSLFFCDFSCFSRYFDRVGSYEETNDRWALDKGLHDKNIDKEGNWIK